VGRVRGQAPQFDRPWLRPGLPERTAWIAGIVQPPGDRHAQGERGQAMEALADALRVEVGGRGDGDDLWGPRAEGAQDMEAAASAGRLDPAPG
jgi:hypothetical protein